MSHQETCSWMAKFREDSTCPVLKITESITMLSMAGRARKARKGRYKSLKIVKPKCQRPGVLLGIAGQRFPWPTPPLLVEQCQETTDSRLYQYRTAWLNITVALPLQTSRRPSSSLTGLVMPRSPWARSVISSGLWGRTLQMLRSTRSWATPAKRVSTLQPLMDPSEDGEL